MTGYYGINLDEIFEELFEHMENSQDGCSCHTIAIQSLNSKMEAAQKLSDKLTPFFYDHMYKSDEYGSKV